MTRSAFSLLEIIIATAVLAASAMVLSSLIGLGTKYGNRAEERTTALSQAESLLDEFLAQLGNRENPLEESTGELPGLPPRSFRIRSTPFELGNQNPASSGESLNDRSDSLLRVTVEMFEVGVSNVSGEAKPLVELSRLIRQRKKAPGPVQGGFP